MYHTQQSASKSCIGDFPLIIKYSVTHHTLKFVKDGTLLCINNIPVWRYHNPVVCILTMFQEILISNVHCTLVLILHISHTIRLLKHIPRGPLGVLTVIVTWKISHIPCVMIFRLVCPENSWLLIVCKICSKYTSIFCVSRVPAIFVRHSLWWHSLGVEQCTVVIIPIKDGLVSSLVWFLYHYSVTFILSSHGKSNNLVPGWSFRHFSSSSLGLSIIQVFSVT